jgi:hypothetical protein
VREKLLKIYLNDHLAAVTALAQAAGRSASSNRGTELESVLHRVANHLDDCKRDLESAIHAVGGKQDRLKLGAAWMAEKAGRLKLNGQLTGYSDLSRLIEIEWLSAGIHAQASMWRSLEEAGDERLASIDFADRIAASTEIASELERHRGDAARRALG